MATLGNQIVLFGGYSVANVYLDDTWTFDGTTWSQLSVLGPSRAHTTRHGHAR